MSVGGLLWSIGESKTIYYPLYKPLQECFLLRIFVVVGTRLCVKLGHYWATI